MGYCEDPSMVRVDFFKPSGKWYCTEAVKWLEGDGDKHPETIFRESLRKHLIQFENGVSRYRLAGMKAVCLESYHKHVFPLMIDVPEN